MKLRSRDRYCSITATTLAEIRATCDRHIKNIGRTAADLVDNGDGTSTDEFYINMIRQMWTDLRDDVDEMIRKEYSMKKFIILDGDYEGESRSFLIDRREVGHFTYDQHGSAAMEDVTNMFYKIAAELGATVIRAEPGEEERD